MSIRALAVELYRATRLVDELEKQLRSPGIGPSKRDELEQELRKARVERDRVRAMLDGAKEG